jgi:hypothetical protein
LLIVGCGGDDSSGGDGGDAGAGGTLPGATGGSTGSGGSTLPTAGSDAGGETGSGGVGIGGNATGGTEETGGTGNEGGTEETGGTGNEGGVEETGGTGNEGGATADECPPTQPEDGDPCDFDQRGMSCTYGDVVCECGGGGPGGSSWDCTEETGEGGEGGSAAVDECPPTQPEDGDSCDFDQNGLTCTYGDVVCECGFAGGGAGMSWSCTEDTGAGGEGGSAAVGECPRREPDDGDSCDPDQEGLSCTYGDVVCECGGGGPGGPSWSCTEDTGAGGEGGSAAVDECPATAPEDGDSCDFAQNGLSCTYGDVVCECGFGGGGVGMSWDCTGEVGAGGGG